MLNKTTAHNTVMQVRFLKVPEELITSQYATNADKDHKAEQARNALMEASGHGIIVCGIPDKDTNYITVISFHLAPQVRPLANS